MVSRLTCVIAAGLCLVASAPGARAEGEAATVYLCPGNIYQDSPCKGGRHVDVSPAATLPAETRSYTPSIGVQSSGPYVGGIPNGREEGFSGSMSPPVPQWPRRPYVRGYPDIGPYPPTYAPYPPTYPPPYPPSPDWGSPYGPGPVYGHRPPMRPIAPVAPAPAVPPPRLPAPNRYLPPGR